MTQQQPALADLYKGWDVYQQHLIEAVSPLTTEQLALRAAPQLRSVGELAAHIIGCRAGWFHLVLGKGDSEFAALGTWDEHEAPERSAAELVKGLEVTWQVIQDALSHWTFADLAELVHYTDEDGKVDTFTRQWVIWHVLEHDMHHGGELSYSLGMHDLQGLDI
jgi:uncharacterized damage-inducible protein DinB